MSSQRSTVMVLPWYVTDDQFIKLMTSLSNVIEDLDCSQCLQLTPKAFLELFNKSQDIQFPSLKQLSMPIDIALPNLVYEGLASRAQNLEYLHNVHQNDQKSCDPLKCFSYFKNSKIRRLDDHPAMNYSRGDSVEESNDKSKKSRWEGDLAKAAISLRNVDEYICRGGSSYLDDRALKRISVLFPGLTSLSLTRCAVSDEGIAQFFLSNKKGLTRLELNRLDGVVSDLTLRLVAEKCALLQSFTLIGCNGVTPSGLQTLFDKCAQIKKLKIGSIETSNSSSKNSHSSTSILNNDVFVTMAKSCKHLSQLVVQNQPDLTSNAFFDSCRYLTNLTELDLMRCDGLNQNVGDSLANLGSLRKLSLTDCDGLTPKSFAEILIRLNWLQQLTLVNDTNQKFYLDSEKVARLAEEAYHSLVQGKSMQIHTDPPLKLSIIGASLRYVRFLAALCSTRNLHRVIFHGREVTSDAADQSEDDLVEIINAVGRGLDSLDLNVRGGLGYTRQFVEAVVNNCLVLQNLNLLGGEDGFLNYLTRSSVCALLKSSQSLKDLVIDVDAISRDDDVTRERLVEWAKQFRGGKVHCKIFDERIIKLCFQPITLNFPQTEYSF